MPSAKSNTVAKHGAKRSRSADAVRGAADDPKSKQSKISPSTHTAQLSGATRNMRFMQRGKTANIVSSRHSYSPKSEAMSSATEKTKGEITNKNFEDAVTKRQSEHSLSESTLANGDGRSNDISLQLKLNISSIKWEKASPLDMFGPTTCILLGRRSYNGFNSMTASNLYMQQQHLEYEEKLKHRRAPNRDGTTKHISSTGKSNQQRYKELSKQAQKEMKPKLLSKNGGKVSNKNGSILDKILKSIDA